MPHDNGFGRYGVKLGCAQYMGNPALHYRHGIETLEQQVAVRMKMVCKLGEGKEKDITYVDKEMKHTEDGMVMKHDTGTGLKHFSKSFSFD